MMEIFCRFYFIVHDSVMPHLPRSQGAGHSSPLSTDFMIVSGRGRECRTMAPYRPYSAMMVLLPHVFSVLRHFARRFWNHTCKMEKLRLWPQTGAYE